MERSGSARINAIRCDQFSRRLNWDSKRSAEPEGLRAVDRGQSDRHLQLQTFQITKRPEILDLEIISSTIPISLYLNLGKNDAFGLWKNLKNVWVFVSQDDFGEKGEFIRKEMKRENVLAIKRRFDSFCKSVKIAAFYTLFSLNILHLPESLADLKNLLKFRGVEVTLNFVHEPKYQSPQFLLKSVKDDEKQQFNNTHTIETAISENELRHFWEMTVKMDAIRKEKVLNALPELSIARDLT